MPLPEYFDHTLIVDPVDLVADAIERLEPCELTGAVIV